MLNAMAWGTDAHKVDHAQMPMLLEMSIMLSDLMYVHGVLVFVSQ